MDTLTHYGAGIARWFVGGDQPYMTLMHCMRHDHVWIGITVALDLTVACGYLLIARHWWQNEKRLSPGPARKALGSMRTIFLFCGICGYLFIPIKMFWPAWRLYDMFLVVLAFYTWRYAWGARELKVLYSELGKSEKLASDLEASREETRRKSFFLNAVSHDLRTPLNGLMLHAETAQMSADAGDGESLRQSLVEIKQAARATADLLDGFLELGRIDWSRDRNNFSTLSLGELVGHVTAAIRPAVDRKGLYLRAEVPKDLRIATDRMKLERILSNLVNNAIKFTASGGIDVEAQRRDDQVFIDVRDTGMGISADDQAMLFQEFFQVQNNERDRRKGFGLGLAIAKRLAEQLGGGLAVESQPGEGSRFRLTLPADAGAPAAIPGQQPQVVCAG